MSGKLRWVIVLHSVTPAKWWNSNVIFVVEGVWGDFLTNSDCIWVWWHIQSCDPVHAHFLGRREKQNIDILCSQRNESWKIPPNNPMYYDWPLFECDRLFCHNARTRLAWNAAQARDGPTWKVISVHILLAVLCSFYQEIATLGNSKAHSSLAYRWTQFLTNFFVVFFFWAGRGQQGQRGHPGPAGLPGEPVSISFSLFFFLVYT